jgi:hypothetical protein
VGVVVCVLRALIVRYVISIDNLQNPNRNTLIQTPYGEIRWGHPFANSIIVNMTAFYILALKY